ncbi:MAG: hydroxymethylbilane synthase [Candidatus Hadarchaeota archaeon]
MELRIGTRGSKLALLQTQLVLKKLKKVVPNLEGEIMVIKTAGDVRRGKIVGGIFVNEINRAVLRGEVDIGVHSMKDLPTKLPRGLEVACVPERMSPNDALVSWKGVDIQGLPRGAVIGTDSPRRAAELSFIRQDLKFMEIRGNIETRISKVDGKTYDGTIVAFAALERLGIENMAAQVFELGEMVPAPGQGALAVVKRKGGSGFLKKINDNRAWKEVTCERAFLNELGSGCRGGAGAVARARGKKINLVAVVHDGGRRLIKLEGKNPIMLGKKAGRILCQEKST